MAYIYKITNKLNNKAYIGKTLLTTEKRFAEHIRDSRKERNENRPLYRAMEKYGAENFSAETIEECGSEVADEREKFWIEEYGTYKDGYNATIGGDGSAYINRDEVAKEYMKTMNIAETARTLDISRDTVTSVLNEKDIRIMPKGYATKQILSRKVTVKDSKTGKVLREFDSQRDAGRWIQSIGKTKSNDINAIAHTIGRVVNGQRKSAFGYAWAAC